MRLDSIEIDSTRVLKILEAEKSMKAISVSLNIVRMDLREFWQHENETEDSVT